MYSRPLTGFEALIGLNPDWVPRVFVPIETNLAYVLRMEKRQLKDKLHKREVRKCSKG